MTSSWKDPGPPSPILPYLRDAFAAAREGHQRSHDTLRDAVCAYVAELRFRGAGEEDIERAVREQLDAMTTVEADAAAPRWRTDLLATILASCDDAELS